MNINLFVSDGLNGYTANLSRAKLKLADIGLELSLEKYAFGTAGPNIKKTHKYTIGLGWGSPQSKIVTDFYPSKLQKFQDPSPPPKNPGSTPVICETGFTLLRPITRLCLP